MRVGGLASVRRAGLDVAWFDSWVDELDEALSELTETSVRPHELYRQLATSQSLERKRTALVTETGSPVAVVALRRSSRVSLTWKPVTGWIVPGEPFPVREGHLGRVLDALGTSLYLPWWRAGSLPPAVRLPQRHVSESRFALKLEPGYEEYWKQSSQWKTVRRSRRRCEGLTLSVNHPSATDWTITNWERRFRPHPQRPFRDLDDRLLAAKYLQARGLVFSFCLLDQGWPVAGETCIVDGDDLVSQYPYRDSTYDRRGIGTRLLDLVFEWAFQRGLSALDLGGAHSYKQRWAPPEGEDSEVWVSPRGLQAVRTVGRRAQELTRAVLPQARSWRD